MPNSFNLSDYETAYIYARPEERKSVATAKDARVDVDGDIKDLTPDKPLTIDSPVTLIGPGHFVVEGIDYEPSAPALRAGKDDVQEPSGAEKRVPKAGKKK